jgi:hypothetical protein
LHQRSSAIVDAGACGAMVTEAREASKACTHAADGSVLICSVLATAVTETTLVHGNAPDVNELTPVGLPSTAPSGYLQ